MSTDGGKVSSKGDGAIVSMGWGYASGVKMIM